MKLKNFYVIIILIFISVINASCYKNITVGKIEGVKINKISQQGVSLEIAVPIKNPNFYKIKIKKADLKIFLNDFELGKIKKVYSFVIPKKSNQVHKLKVDIEVSNFMTGLFALMSSLSKRKIKIKINGKIKAKASIFSKSIKVDEESNVKLFK